MIYDHLNNAGRYAKMHPGFEKAFDFLYSNDVAAMENGTYTIDGEEVFAIVNSYDTEPEEKRIWEAHKKYIDIQYIAAGKEKMAVAPLHTMHESQAYNEEKDFSLFKGEGTQFLVDTGYFTIFYPADVHMPNIAAGQPEFVKKVVFKVRVPDPLLTLCFATNNAHKLHEVTKKINPELIRVLSLEEAGINAHNIPEKGKTLEENADQKAEYIYNNFGRNCFADDTGLEVEALGGEPGVYSARYAGPGCNAEENVKKLMAEMEGKTNRSARFRTVITLILDAAEYRFEGIINGSIAYEPKGDSGFGYDPVFIPDGYTQTFAEMPLKMKNKISHRALAVEKLVKFLTKEFSE